MIIRPIGLKVVSVNIDFNFQAINFLEIDLKHINKKGRSKYSPRDVADIVTELIDGLRLRSSAVRNFGDEACSYFVRTGLCYSNEFKLVFCICSDSPDTIGVITLFRI